MADGLLGADEQGAGWVCDKACFRKLVEYAVAINNVLCAHAAVGPQLQLPQFEAACLALRLPPLLDAQRTFTVLVESACGHQEDGAQGDVGA